MATELAQVIERELGDVAEYEKTHFGLKCGSDFPHFVEALMQSEKFRQHLQAATIIGMFNTMLMPKKPEGADKLADGELDKFISQSMLREPLAQLFYAGYKVGRAVAEQECLERSAPQQ